MPARKPCSLIHLPSGAGRGGGTEEDPADQVHPEKRQLNGNSSCNRFKANFNKSSTVAETGHRLATIDMGRKVGRGAVSLSVLGAVVSLGLHNAEKRLQSS